MSVLMRARTSRQDDVYEEDDDRRLNRIDDARTNQAIVPLLIQLVPIGFAYILWTTVLPSLVVPTLALAVIAFFVAAYTFDDDD